MTPIDANCSLFSITNRLDTATGADRAAQARVVRVLSRLVLQVRVRGAQQKVLAAEDRSLGFWQRLLGRVGLSSGSPSSAASDDVQGRESGAVLLAKTQTARLLKEDGPVSLEQAEAVARSLETPTQQPTALLPLLGVASAETPVAATRESALAAGVGRGRERKGKGSGNGVTS